VSCLLCGEKDERSKVPSWRCVTGMSRGASSEDRTLVKEVSADTQADSRRWKAGLKLEIIDGVRTRTEGLAIVVDAPWRCG